MIAAYAFSIYKTDKWEKVYQMMGSGNEKRSQDSYNDAVKKYGFDNRKEIVGDDPNDITDPLRQQRLTDLRCCHRHYESRRDSRQA